VVTTREVQQLVMIPAPQFCTGPGTPEISTGLANACPLGSLMRAEVQFGLGFTVKLSMVWPLKSVIE